MKTTSSFLPAGQLTSSMHSIMHYIHVHACLVIDQALPEWYNFFNYNVHTCTCIQHILIHVHVCDINIIQCTCTCTYII